jgi:NADP-dependent 3-hydroxy acid dehydrogenase YdfG
MIAMPVTLITGAASGIGAATVAALRAAGHRVAVTGRDADRLAALPPGDDLLTVTADPAAPSDVDEAVAATVRRFGRLDNVIANAGYSTHDTLADGDPAQWREMLLVNVLGPMVLIRAALPALSAAVADDNTPRIVLVGSVAGIKHTPGNVYSVTKWAVTGLAENARLLVTGQGIGVTLIAPGRVDTPFWDSRDGGRPPGPALTAEDIAGSIAWTLAQPAGVDMNTVVVRPVGQQV